jgi:hypothetical protein
MSILKTQIIKSDRAKARADRVAAATAKAESDAAYRQAKHEERMAAVTDPHRRAEYNRCRAIMEAPMVAAAAAAINAAARDDDEYRCGRYESDTLISVDVTAFTRDEAISLCIASGWDRVSWCTRVQDIATLSDFRHDNPECFME